MRPVRTGRHGNGQQGQRGGGAGPTPPLAALAQDHVASQGAYTPDAATRKRGRKRRKPTMGGALNAPHVRAGALAHAQTSTVPWLVKSSQWLRHTASELPSAAQAMSVISQHSVPSESCWR